MDIVSCLFVILGLALFESITGIDNAIINAETLATTSQRARRWFLTWGIIFAVFVVRGGLPWLIVWLMAPGLPPGQAFLASITGDASALAAIKRGSPILLAGGGIFFIFLFLHWLFLEPKSYGLPLERSIARQGAWFYAIVSLLLAVVVWFALAVNPMLAFGAVVGSTGFFITHGFRSYAEEQERILRDGRKHLSDIGKILYLEVIDMTFSIDGIVGAFAFTLSVPLILVGNGIGAIIVRQITYYGVERIRRYVYLKNGAMYSVLLLGIFMLAHGFGFHVPEWLSPIATFIIVGYFFFRSVRLLRRENAASRTDGHLQNQG
jgi:hypothetical protein